MNQQPKRSDHQQPSVQNELVKNCFSESNILDLLPTAVCVCDINGFVIKYNEQAVKMWGRSPNALDRSDSYCGSYRLYSPDGTRLMPEQYPAAQSLRNGININNAELIIERPDQSSVTVSMDTTLLYDEAGKPVGVISCFHDISSHKEMEKQLKVKSNELEDYVNNANVGLHWVDANGIIKWANRAELEMLGYTEEEYIGHHIAEFHVNRNKINDILRKLSCNEQLNQYESELLCKDGSVKIVHINSSVYRDEGKFIHTRCFTIDVSEQKALFHALKESEMQYKSVVNNLPAAIYTCDKDGRITFFNEVAVALWGYTPDINNDSLKYCACYKVLVNDRYIAPENTPMAVCLKEKRIVKDEEILVVRPDGSLRHVVPHPQPVFDESGNMTGAINMLIDITELKKAEAALRESENNYRQLASSLEQKVEEKTLDLLRKTNELKKSEERYHKMVEQVEDYAIILLDKDGTIMNWNKGAEKIKGYKEDEIVGKNFQEFYLEADRKNGLPSKLLQFAKENGKAVHEGFRQRKDGSTLWGSIVLTALHDDEGKLIGFSKVTRDLTEKKLIEDRMKEYMSRLEFQNGELEQFVYAASHDMKEPLRKISFYNSFIAEAMSNKLDSKSTEYLNRSIDAAERMKTLIEDLLTYSRSTYSTDSFENVDLNKIIDEINMLQADDTRFTGGRILAEKIPLFRGVAFQMKQLMINLISNSIRYKHPNRDVDIRINCVSVNGNEVNWQYAEKEKQYYKISITDNGIGFDQKYTGKIFEIFQRLNGVRDKKGSGIGLAICKKIVQNHKGYITATGIPGVGACFSFYIPND